MDFALMFCPYCGGDIETGDGSRYLCKECGKSIYTDRESIRQFIRPGELEDTFREALDALEDDNPKKALALADDILKASEETDFDAFFLRGAIYAYEGEDGKAFNDWKRGLELLSVYTNIDAYVCLMTRCVSEMIFKKEEEFVEFHPVKYLDKLCDEIYANTNESCKAFMYYSVYMEYRKILGRNEASGNEGFNEIVPELFRRVVEYGHNFWSLPHVINEYLAAIGYDPETYEDDDQEDKIVKHSKSNAIVLAKGKQLYASGVGQTSRVDSLRHAIDKAKSFGFDLNGAVMASDAFFPFADCVEIAHNEGIDTVIQPGGSVRDGETVEYCNKNGVAMVFTGIRHFKH